MISSSIKCSTSCREAIAYFEKFPSDQFEVVELCYYKLDLRAIIGYRLRRILTLKTPKPQHWYAVLRNKDQSFDFILEFSTEGVSVRSRSRRDTTLHKVGPRGLAKNGHAITKWLRSLRPDYNFLKNNCQDFVKALCYFM